MQDEEAAASIRQKILADGDLTVLAKGSPAKGNGAFGPDVEGVVREFESTLPRPQGFVSGMAQTFHKIPRLRMRVELFRRLNCRLPTLDEAGKLYPII